MTDKELSNILKTDARRLGLCDQWYGDWKEDTNKQELINLYIRGLDFCIERRWPSKQFVKHHFPQDLLRENGILVDDIRSYPVRNPETRRLIYLKDYVLIGESSTVIRYSFRPHVCNVWAMDTSKVTVDVKYGAYILIHLFDKATADVTTDLVSKCTVIRHSENTKVTRNGCVNIKEEFDYLNNKI